MGRGSADRRARRSPGRASPRTVLFAASDARDELRAVVLKRRTAALVAETSSGTVELTRLGTREDRDRALSALRARIVRDGAGPPMLPPGWEEVITPEGVPAAVASPRTRTAQARVASVLAFGLGTIGIVLGRETIDHRSLVPLAVVVAAGGIRSEPEPTAPSHPAGAR